MTDQTPSTEDDLTLTIEDVRYRYAYESRYQEVLESDLAEFDDWLAAHDREVAAKALRDAVDELAALNEPEVFVRAGALLDARADRIEAGE